MRSIAGADVAIKVGEAGEENCGVPEMKLEFRLWEEGMEGEDQEWNDEAGDETIWDGAELGFLEEFLRALE